MIPLFVNNPESMVKVRVMAVKDDSEKTLKTLHKIGVLHVEESKELKPVDRAAITSERNEVNELLTFVDNVLSYIPEEEQVSLGADVEVIYTRPFSEIGGEVRSLYNKVNSLYERTVKLRSEAEQLTELRGYLEPLASQPDLRLRDLDFSGDYLFSRIFVLSGEAYNNLHNKLKNYLFENIVANVGDETVFHALARIRDQKTVESLITEAGGKIIPVPDEDLALRDFIKNIRDKLIELEEEVTKLYAEIQSKAGEDLHKLALLRETLSAENERLLVLEKASEAKYVTLIEGWVPESDAEAAITAVRENIDYVFVDTRKPSKQEEPPVKLKNVAGIKPFQVILNLFATPKYREWDPTPVISYSFAFFFGLMVADVIYALGIILLSKFLLSKFVDDPEAESFKLFRKLIYISGGVALVIGLLAGSYLGDFYKFFGIESLALVEGVKQALQDPILFITVALGVGFIHINIGHLLALIKGAKEGQKGLVINKIGLFLLQLGIPTILHSLLNINIPLFTEQVYSILLYVMAGGVVLAVVGSIMDRGGLGIILGIFDLTGILGDIMSYARLAGVGLATFYLGSAFNMLGELFFNMMPGVIGAIIGGIAGVVMLVVGHILNTVLSSLTGFIHALRLCFVEFLFKFYEGGGREYSPFKLKKRASVLITAKT